MRMQGRAAAAPGGANALLLGVAALLGMLILLVAVAIRAFTQPPLEALTHREGATAPLAVASQAPARDVALAGEAAAPRADPVVLRPSPPQPLSGAARVVDTATIEVGGRTVRLRGVSGEGGAQAKELARWIGGREVDCAPSVGERHVCEVGGRDLAQVVLFNGGGRATVDAPPALRRAERQARAARRGMWSAEAQSLAPGARRR